MIPLWETEKPETAKEAGFENMFDGIFQSPIENVKQTDAEKPQLQYLMATGQLDNPAKLILPTRNTKCRWACWCNCATVPRTLITKSCASACKAEKLPAAGLRRSDGIGEKAKDVWEKVKGSVGGLSKTIKVIIITGIVLALVGWRSC